MCLSVDILEETVEEVGTGGADDQSCWVDAVGDDEGEEEHLRMTKIRGRKSSSRIRDSAQRTPIDEEERTKPQPNSARIDDSSSI